MVDLPGFRKGDSEEKKKSLPAAPRPGSDMDLPAPAPPMKKEASPEARMQGPEILPPAKPQREAPPTARPPETPSRGIEAIKPLSISDIRPRPPSDTRHIEEIADIHGSPPVFIKVDKYTEIVRNLGRLKSYALSLRDALDALADIEKEITTGISIAHKALDDFNTTIAILDSKLLRASAIKDMTVNQPDDVDNYIKGIYDQMDKIKAELRSLGHE
jgi:hypothetical protein